MHQLLAEVWAYDLLVSDLRMFVCRSLLPYWHVGSPLMHAAAPHPPMLLCGHSVRQRAPTRQLSYHQCTVPSQTALLCLRV